MFLVITFSTFVSASEIGLIENEAWQSNLTGSGLHNGAVFGDIDGDGDLDMVSIGCTAGIIFCTAADKSYVWINNGTSFVENTIWEQNLSNVKGGSISLGDIDNDGDLDLVLSLVEGGGTKIYINNGTTFFENSTWQNLLLGNDGADSNSIALGDIDNDGDLDLIFPGMEPNRVFWINNGTSFVNNSIWGSEIVDDTGKLSIGLADFDNDGDLDINIMGLSSARGYINNGTSFNPDSNWNTATADEGSIIWGDIDNDGDFDAVLSRIAGSCADGDLVFINNGSTLLTDSSWASDMIGFQFGSLSIGDYDNNGYLGLASSGKCGGNPTFHILSNNGSIFSQDGTAQANLTGVSQSSSLWGDVDNDGDLDLIVIGLQKVYINNITTPNTAPTPPNGFSYSYNNRKISLGWLNGGDTETNSTGLYYNLKLGTASNNHSIISGIYGGQGDASNGGGTAFGYFGNMMQRKNFSLSVDRLLPNTNYTWYVQTIDTGLKAGNWSTVQSFTTGADLERPNVTLNTPVSDANLSSYTVTFNATVSDNFNLSNVSLWGNWTGTFQVNETNSSGLNNSDYIFTKNLSSYGDGIYTWMIQAEDNETNVQNSSIRTFTIDTTAPSFVNLTNQTTVMNTSFSYEINATDNGVGLGNFSINDTGNFSINYSTGIVTNATILQVGYYVMNVTVNDTLGNLNWSLWGVNITPDTTNPNITINSPTAGQTLTSTNVTINISFSDNVALDYCSYNVTNSAGGTLINDTNVTCGSNSVEYQTISDGTNYVLNVFANDTSGNQNNTNRTFSIDTTAPVSPPGGGGGGTTTTSFWTSTEVVSDSDFEKGVVKELSKKQRVKVSVNSENHYVGVVDLTNTTATINITSDPVQVVLSIGEEAKVDVLDDGFYDLFVRLNDIVNQKANLTIQSIHKEVKEGDESVVVSGEGEEEIGEVEEEKKRLWLWIVIGIVVIIIVYFYLRSYLWKRELNKRRKRWQK